MANETFSDQSQTTNSSTDTDNRRHDRSRRGGEDHRHHHQQQHQPGAYRRDRRRVHGRSARRHDDLRSGRRARQINVSPIAFHDGYNVDRQHDLHGRPRDGVLGGVDGDPRSTLSADRRILRPTRSAPAAIADPYVTTGRDDTAGGIGDASRRRQLHLHADAGFTGTDSFSYTLARRRPRRQRRHAGDTHRHRRR